MRRWTAAVVAGALALAACGDDDGGSVREIGDGSGSASGSPSGVASGSPSGSPTGASSGPSAAFGGYEPASDVAEHARVSRDVCEINEALDADPIDFDAAARAYTEGGSSTTGDGSARTLAEFAREGAPGEPTWDLYVDHYGDATFLDGFVTAALEGTGPFAGEPDAVRRQGVQKGTQNQVLILWTLHELDAALAKAAAGDVDPNEGAPHNWDEAWAFYHGEEPACAPHATADKRGENFGTGTAVNDAILAEMQAGLDALLAGDVDRATAARDEIVHQIQITYLQATTRYAHQIDDKLADGDAEGARVSQAEGWAFFRVIEPMLAAADADAAGAIAGVFDLGAPPAEGAAATVDEAVAALAPALGIADVELGTLQDG